jgi:hypothetical protein
MISSKSYQEFDLRESLKLSHEEKSFSFYLFLWFHWRMLPRMLASKFLAQVWTERTNSGI